MATFYGSDTACISDIGLIDTQITDPVQLIGQRIGRRWQTPTGAMLLINDDAGGFDVRQFLNAKMGPNDLKAASVALQSEALKDGQVFTASVSCSIANGYLTITGDFTSASGPFSLTMNVGQLSSSLVFG